MGESRRELERLGEKRREEISEEKRRDEIG